MTRVLVIDDQKIPRVTVCAVLAESGYEAEAAASGPEGIERARAWAPDVVVLDVQMPGMDGFETVRHLKRDPRTAPIPVIFLTAEAPNDALVVRGLDLGAYDFLNKGCSRAELRARVAAMARIKRSHDELAALARLSGAGLRAEAPTEMAGRLAREVADTFRADAALLRLTPDGGAPPIRGAAGLPDVPGVADALAAEVAPPEEDAVETAEPVLRFLEGEVAAALPAGRAGPFRAAAAVRVPRAEGALLLAVLAHDPDAFRHPGDGPLLELLGRQAALALDNAILHARTRAQAETLEEQAERLERAMTERSRFFASMSHELRTPINAILGYGTLLEDGLFGELGDRQRGATRRLLGSASHLLELVNDILDISKLEAGKMEVVPEPVDLAPLLRELMTLIELQAREKGLELEVHAATPVRVVTDPGRVRQIVLNLLSNAVKFTERGRVELTLEADPEGGAVVRVVDTGRGVAQEDTERIFSEFEQVPGSGAHTGTGLGLPISRRLAILLGGGLTLRSRVGQGSEFVLRLPAEVPPPPSGRRGDGGQGTVAKSDLR